MPTPTTRLAPSPTGALHLGNARTFLINWAIARQNGDKIVLRIEDLDSPRLKPGTDLQAIQDLQWLGLDWDQGPFYQRHDLAPYQKALDQLHARNLVYPCVCKRKDIRLAQRAPHADEHELRYPGTCRPAAPPQSGDLAFCSPVLGPIPADQAVTWRVVIPDEPVCFVDQLHGPQQFNAQQQVGDFIVATKTGLPAYQLAVVVDDARQGVTHVVRGDDLLPSTARQLWLYRLLGLTPPRGYLHVPLVLGPDGHRLAKRHGDSRLIGYRQQGVSPERVIGLISRWCGLQDNDAPVTASQFLERFVPQRLDPAPVTLTKEDHAWLVAS